MTPPIRMVSVPVEPDGVEIDGYALSQYGSSAFKVASDQGQNQHGAINAAYREMVRRAAMLTASPVREEGGVVLAKRVSPGEAINRAVGDEVLTAKALESITTAGWVFAHKDDIATREEAPAEAGETIEARFPELNDDLIRMASTGSTGSLIEWGAFIERLKSALRAQPQASSGED